MYYHFQENDYFYLFIPEILDQHFIVKYLIFTENHQIINQYYHHEPLEDYSMIILHGFKINELNFIHLKIKHY